MPRKQKKRNEQVESFNLSITTDNIDYVKIMKNLLDFINCYDIINIQPQTVSVARLNCYTLLTEVIPKVNSMFITNKKTLV